MGDKRKMTLSINGKTYEVGELIAYVKKLEKENAELKKKNLNAQDAVTMQMYTNKANKEIANKQLTKAKELLKRYVPYRQITDSKAYKDLADETEQFLNSEVEK